LCVGEGEGEKRVEKKADAAAEKRGEGSPESPFR